MKKAILGTSLLLITLDLLGQGSVILYNRSTPGTTHVWSSSSTNPEIYFTGPGSNDSPSGTTPYAASDMILIGANGIGGRFGAATTFAQLLAANGTNQPESSLVPMGQTTTFRTGAAAGGLAQITDTLEGIPRDSEAATLELVAWDNSSGLYPTWTQVSVAWYDGLVAAGKSGAFTVYQIGGTLYTPPQLYIPSFNIFLQPGPEPSTLGVASLGAVMLLLFRRRK